MAALVISIFRGMPPDTCKNEFIYAKRFYELNPFNFIKPWYYKYDGDKKFIAMDYVDGDLLESILEKNTLTEAEKDKFSLDI